MGFRFSYNYLISQNLSRSNLFWDGVTKVKEDMRIRQFRKG